MTYQQATYVKELLNSKTPLNKLAESFYLKFGKTEYCEGPESCTNFKGKKIATFSSLQGNDIMYAASIKLRERLEQKNN
jgi:hypothetical protein